MLCALGQVIIANAMVFYKLLVDEWLPRTPRYQSIDGLIVSHAEGAIWLQMLLTHCKNCEAARSQRSEHIVKALCRQQIRAQTSRTSDNIKSSPVGLG